MKEFTQLFDHLPEYRVIICRSCGYAVIPQDIRGHLRVLHKDVAHHVQQRIAEIVGSLGNVARRPEDVQYPVSPCAPIPGLPVLTCTYQCIFTDEAGWRCDYVCGGQKLWGIQRHCIQVHGWTNQQGRGGRVKGRQKQTPNRMWIEGRCCQRFFPFRRWQKYFVVQDAIAQDGVGEVRTWEARATTIFEQYESAIEEARSQRRVEDDSNRSVPNAWLAFTGWAGHLSQFQTKEQIQAYIQPTEGDTGDDGDDGGLEDACRGTRRLIRAAFEKCKPEIVGKTALEAVNRRETGAESNERPFYAGQQKKTIRKYSDVAVQMLRYIWRTAPLEERPKYVMTEHQAKWLEKLREVAAPVGTANDDDRPTQGKTERKDERRQAIEDICLTFWIAMFDHELKDGEFHSGIMSGLAVLGVDSQNGSWKPALNYTPILSAVVATMRALVVYRAWQIRQRSIRDKVSQGWSEEEAANQARSIVEGVDMLVQRFMTLREFGGRISPMDRILRMRTYGLKIRMTTKAGGTVSWEGGNVLVNKIRFSMDDVRTVIHGLYETARKRLKTELLLIDGGGELPPLHIQSMADNAAELAEGWNFLQDKRNVLAVDGERWMWRRMFQEAKIEQQFVTGGLEHVQSREDIQWNPKAVEDYFRQVRRFKEEVAVLAHMAGGSPARATELISIQAENGPDGRGQRGIFIDNGMLAMVTSYHKGWSASKKAKIIHRYEPDEVAKLIGYSMWLLEPWVRQLQNMVYGQTDFSPFMWEPKPEEDWKASEDEDQGFPDDDNDDSHDDDDEWSDDGTESPPEPRNVDGYWDTDRVRRVMQRETRKRIGVGIGVSDWRHAYPAIQREHTREQSVREALDCIYDNRTPRIRHVEDAVAEQAGHSRYMEDMIYGLLLTESPTATVMERDMFRKVSIDWHRFLRFPSAWEEHTTDPIVQKRLESERLQAQMRRWKQMREVDVAAQAKRLYGADARFRGVQEAALNAIIVGHPRILVVMRTGGGKSWLFMLPAAGSVDGVTIVIVPTVSLRQDFMDRCNHDGIPCAEWDGSRPPYQARIVLVTPESAVSQAFGRFIDEKRTMYQLERIVIDECHTILESTADWRPRVLELCRMAEKGVQVLYLTATLPPGKEPMFFGAVGVPEKDMMIFRDDTSRPKIAYRIVEYERDREGEQVRELVERKKKEYPAPGQIVVYCKKVEQARRLAKILQCSVYHRTVGSNEEKKGILRRLTGQRERVFTATNALGLGVDVPTIRAVIHVGVREELAQYAQESGRAGRDGLESEAIIMRARWQDRNGQVRLEQGWRAEAAMKEVIGGAVCRRVALDKHMDGRHDRSGCQEGEEKCDICRGYPRGMKRRRVVFYEEEEQERRTNKKKRVGEAEAGEEARAKEREESERFRAEQREYRRMEEQRRREVVNKEDGIEYLRRQFEAWSGQCIICRVRGREEEGRHDWRECPYGEADRQAVQKRWDWLGGIWFEAYSGCLGCWAAQAVCHSWENISHSGPQRFRRRGKGWSCQFPGVLQDVAAGVLAIGHGEVIGEWMDEQMGKTGMERRVGEGDWEVRRRWMGRRVQMGGVEMNGLCAMLWELGEG